MAYGPVKYGNEPHPWIDRQGIIRYRWVTDDALVLPDFDAAIAVLRQL